MGQDSLIQTSKAEILAGLRSRIKHIEGFKPLSQHNAVRLGIPEIDNRFPDGCFPLSATHEFVSDSAEAKAAAISFIATLVGRVNRRGNPIIWITQSQSLYAPGLLAYGLDPEQLIVVEAYRDKEALWLMEEALRCQHLSLSVCELNSIDLASSRRLQLAVEKSGTTGFVIRKDAKGDVSTACVTRWAVHHDKSEQIDGLPGVGLPRWTVELQKVRHGQPGTWQVEWRQDAFHLVAGRTPETQDAMRRQQA